MLCNYDIFFQIISTIFIVLYSLKYILNDIYYFLKTNSEKAKVNKILPLLTKYNTLFILISFISSIFHIYCNYSYTTIFRPGYLILFLIIALIITKIFNKYFIKFKQYIDTLPYLLLLSLIIHICFR